VVSTGASAAGGGCVDDIPAISGIGADGTGTEAVAGVSCWRQAAASRIRMTSDRFIASSERMRGVV